MIHLGAVPARALAWDTRRPPDVLASEDFRANGHGGPVTSLLFRSPESHGAADGPAVEGIAAPPGARRAQGLRRDDFGLRADHPGAAARAAPHHLVHRAEGR